MYSTRALAGRLSAHFRRGINHFRSVRWPRCRQCGGLMMQEAEPKHVQMDLSDKASWHWLYLLRCTKCANLKNYAENSITGNPHAGVFGEDHRGRCGS